MRIRCPPSLVDRFLYWEFFGGGFDCGVRLHVQFDDAWQLGLKVDELNEGRFLTVFIPDSPTPETGSVVIVAADRVVPANMSVMSAFSCLKGRGAGINDILRTQERA